MYRHSTENLQLGKATPSSLVLVVTYLVSNNKLLMPGMCIEAAPGAAGDVQNIPAM